tara:strand:- start:190 stop:603 length:414 start_codon:yes stop_codon:yes gene_type:complete
MEIKDVQANQGNIDLVAQVREKEEPRSFEKFGKEGRVCNAKLSDETGEIKLTLWNDDIDSVEVGDKIHLQNGWCSEYKGEKQLSSGKFGKIEIVSKAEPEAAAPQEVFTNSPEMLSPSEEQEPESEEGGDVEEEFVE